MPSVKCILFFVHFNDLCMFPSPIRLESTVYNAVFGFSLSVEADREIEETILEEGFTCGGVI